MESAKNDFQDRFCIKTHRRRDKKFFKAPSAANAHWLIQCTRISPIISSVVLEFHRYAQRHHDTSKKKLVVTRHSLNHKIPKMIRNVELSLSNSYFCQLAQ